MSVCSDACVDLYVGLIVLLRVGAWGYGRYVPSHICPRRHVLNLLLYITVNINIY